MSDPEIYAASKPFPPARGPPAATAAMMSLNPLGIAGVGEYLANRTCPASPSTIVEMLASLTAYSSAGGPRAADGLKLRKEMSTARADCAGKHKGTDNRRDNGTETQQMLCVRFHVLPPWVGFVC